MIVIEASIASYHSPDRGKEPQGIHQPTEQTILIGDMANGSSGNNPSLNRRQIAQALNIPPEMAARNGIPSRLSAAEVAEIDTNPPAWLAQSRANSTGKRPVWVELRCYICDFHEIARPKKWWPEFSYVVCDFHDDDQLPEPAPSWRRSKFDGVGSRFTGVVDTQDLPAP